MSGGRLERFISGSKAMPCCHSATAVTATLQLLTSSGSQAVNTFILSIQQNQNPPLTVLGTGILSVFLRTTLSESNENVS